MTGLDSSNFSFSSTGSPLVAVLLDWAGCLPTEESQSHYPMWVQFGNSDA